MVSYAYAANPHRDFRMGRSLVALAATILATTLSQPTPASGQSDEVEVERALLAAPEGMGADATVIRLEDGGVSTVLQDGSNGLLCWDSSGHDYVQWTAQCTSMGNWSRVEQNHQLQTSGATEAQLRVMMERAESTGTRALSEYGSVYFHVVGDSLGNVSRHTTVAVPFATSESLGGVPTERRPAGIWLMQAGTSSAHLMLPAGL